MDGSRQEVVLRDPIPGLGIGLDPGGVGTAVAGGGMAGQVLELHAS